jgi:hypothetical protein
MLDGDWSSDVCSSDLGAELPVLDTLGAVLLVAGLVLVGLSGIGLWLAVRQR